MGTFEKHFVLTLSPSEAARGVGKIEIEEVTNALRERARTLGALAQESAVTFRVFSFQGGTRDACLDVIVPASEGPDFTDLALRAGFRVKEWTSDDDEDDDEITWPVMSAEDVPPESELGVGD